MDILLDKKSSTTYPAELVLALNKAETVSRRLGIAWTLTSEFGTVLTCNGALFNLHIQHLLNDISKYASAKRLYISYCPLIDDQRAETLFENLRKSNLTKIHIHAHKCEEQDVSNLSEMTAIPTVLWPRDQTHFSQSSDIDWVRSINQPWTHIVCSNSIGSGVFSLDKMSEQLGVLPYVALKGIQSSLFYVQDNCNSSIDKKLNIAKPKYVDNSQELITLLRNLSSATSPLVTVVCDPNWLALIVRMNLAKEVSYFVSLQSKARDTKAAPSVVDFPEIDQWMTASLENMGKFKLVTLQKR